MRRTSRSMLMAFTLSAAAGCASQPERPSSMIYYEEAQEAEESAIVRERSPELHNAAEFEYTDAIKAERAKEYEAAAHHSQVALLLWRTAEARSLAADAAERQAMAERRFAIAEAALAKASAERDEETMAIARLEKIITLQREMAAAAKAMATQKQSERAKAATNAAMLAAMVALKDAEAVQASTLAPEPFARAQEMIALATAALGASDLAGAEKHAVAATAVAEEAKLLATPKFEADRARRTYEERLRSLFEEVKEIGGVRKISERGVAVTLQDVFESNEIFVSPISRSALETAAKLAAKYGDFALIVEAHTDNRGGTTANLVLSKSRADAVLTFLTNKGVAPSRITALGKGSTEPIADNRSKDGRAANRRVEITFIPPKAP